MLLSFSQSSFINSKCQEMIASLKKDEPRKVIAFLSSAHLELSSENFISLLEVALKKNQPNVINALFELPFMNKIAKDVFDWAATNGFSLIVQKMLLAKFAFSELDLVKALFDATRNRHQNTVDTLLSLTSVKTAITNNTILALHWAAIKGDLRTINQCLVKDDVTKEGNSLLGCLRFAIECGQLAVVKQFFNNPEECLRLIENPHIIAAEKGQLEVLEYLLTLPQINNDPQVLIDIFHASAKNGHKNIVDYCLINSTIAGHLLAIKRVLLDAAKHGHLELFKSLLSLPILINNPVLIDVDLPPMAQFALNGSMQPLTFAFAATNSVSTFFAALVVAAYAGKEEIINELLKIPALKAQMNNHDYIALRQAAKNNETEVLVRFFAALTPAELQDALKKEPILVDFYKKYKAKADNYLIAFSQVLRHFKNKGELPTHVGAHLLSQGTPAFLKPLQTLFLTRAQRLANATVTKPNARITNPTITPMPMVTAIPTVTPMPPITQTKHRTPKMNEEPDYTLGSAMDENEVRHSLRLYNRSH